MSNSKMSKSRSLSISIRSRFILINLTLLISVFIYAVSEKISFDKLDSLELAAAENLKSSIDLLTLRRHEKDFLARNEQKYVERFDITANILNQRLVNLTQTLNLHQLHLPEKMARISNTLNQYQRQFHLLVDQVNDIDDQ